MCYNCGCGKPEDYHGNPKNITNKTFKEEAQATNMTVRQAKAKTKTLLPKVLATKPAAKLRRKTA